jgi:ribosome maturation factor RimP
VESSTANIWSLAEPIARELGLEVLEVELAGGGARRVRIYLDSPDQGRAVTLADCEALSRRLGDVLDAHEAVRGRYMLEVSSPGVNRPLRKREHFEHVVGGRIRARAVEADGNKHTLLGRLVRLDGDLIEVETDDGELHRVALSDVERANYEFDFGDANKQRRTKKR